MKTTFTISLITFIFFNLMSTTLTAQEIKSPLKDYANTDLIPISPGENWTWVKAHWNWDGGKYKWKKGMFVQIIEGNSWQDGEWERDSKSGWWKYNDGYWQKDGEVSAIENDKNTAEKDKVAKEARRKNKWNGLYIKIDNDSK